MRLIHIFEYDEYDEPWEPETYRLPAGTLLYHGTDADFDERRETLHGPLWVSDSESVAEQFSSRNGQDGPSRVITFETADDLHLWHITGRDTFDEFEEHTGFDMCGSSGEMAEAVCDHLGLDGWIIPNNYMDGADIMLCSDRVLRHVGTSTH